MSRLCSQMPLLASYWPSSKRETVTVKALEIRGQVPIPFPRSHLEKLGNVSDRDNEVYPGFSRASLQSEQASKGPGIARGPPLKHAVAKTAFWRPASAKPISPWSRAPKARPISMSVASRVDDFLPRSLFRFCTEVRPRPFQHSQPRTQHCSYCHSRMLAPSLEEDHVSKATPSSFQIVNTRSQPPTCCVGRELHHCLDTHS
jgi:hypothetical protein